MKRSEIRDQDLAWLRGTATEHSMAPVRLWTDESNDTVIQVDGLEFETMDDALHHVRSVVAADQELEQRQAAAALAALEATQ